MNNVVIPTAQVQISNDKVLLQYTTESEPLEFDFNSHKFKSSKETVESDLCTNFIGVLGTIQLLKGSYLIAIKESKVMGEIKKTQIQMIKTVNILPIGSQEKLTKEQQDIEDNHLDSVKKLLEENYFYFSLENNISQSFQSKLNSKEVDDQFIWNFNLYDQKYSNHFLQIIQGFVDIKDCSIDKFDFKFALISRRSRYRAGTRFNKRGINKNGQVANFVETEQIIETSNDFSSYLIIRGSIPLIWKQKPSLKYEPKVDLNSISSEKSKNSFTKHFEKLVNTYGGPIVCIDLTKEKGFEGKLKKEFNNQCNESTDDQIEFISFDLHKICGHSKYENLKYLDAKIEGYFDKIKFFTIGTSNNNSHQSGVFRINCKDSLDRTNLIETFISKTLILKQIAHVGGPSKLYDFETDFRYSWSDNGDAISEFYAGTGALRSYISKTGKSSFTGLVSDGYKSTLRYYLNNLSDGSKQDSIDILLGNISYEYIKDNSIYDEKMNAGFIGGFLLFIFSYFKPKSVSTTLHYFIAMFWLFTFIIFWMFCCIDGKRVVNRPKYQEDIDE
eukprot:gene12562-6382_t